MQNFQSIVFKWQRTYREILKSALKYFLKNEAKEEIGKQSQAFDSIIFFPRLFLPVNSFQKLNFFILLLPENYFRSLSVYG